MSWFGNWILGFSDFFHMFMDYQDSIVLCGGACKRSSLSWYQVNLGLKMTTVISFCKNPLITLIIMNLYIKESDHEYAERLYVFSWKFLFAKLEKESPRMVPKKDQFVFSRKSFHLHKGCMFLIENFCLPKLER